MSVRRPNSCLAPFLLFSIAHVFLVHEAGAFLLSFRSLGLSSFLGRVTTCPEGSIAYAGSIDIADCVCIPGRYKLNGVCEMCPANTYKHEVGDSVCTTCPADTLSLPGASSVDACLCDIGYGLTGDVGAANMCQQCSPGAYKDFVANAACLQCPQNSSSLAWASSSVGDCICLPGYSGGALDNNCKPCDIGFYKTAQHAECQQCPSFTTTEQVGSDTLEHCVCVQGYTAANAGEACEPCASGLYKDFTGSVSCLECPANSTSAEAATSLSNCVCEPGFTTDGSSCVTCASASYKTTTGNEPCTPCPEHATSSPGAATLTACVCLPGYHGPGTACTACANDFYCPGDVATYACPANSSSPALSSSEDACTCDDGFAKEDDNLV